VREKKGGYPTENSTKKKDPKGGGKGGYGRYAPLKNDRIA